jgi:hypothetical protein
MFEAASPTSRWSVSTLVPGLRGSPSYSYFDTESQALKYARSRARTGPRYKKSVSGRVYYVMSATGNVLYRVFRALQQLEVPHGTQQGARREYVVVQRNDDLIPGTNRTRWVFDKALSVEIIDIAAERDAKRRAPAKPRQRIRGEFE